jgi:NAD(P) transhydrogenase
MPAQPASSPTVFDLIVIGSGPAGQRAALQGAKAGKRVALIEQHDAVGGGCVHWGTIPSKSFRESVYRWSLGSRGTLGRENAHDMAPGAERRKLVLPQMSRLVRRRERVISNEAQIVFDQLKRNGIAVLSGKARLVGRHEVQVEGARPQRIRGEFIFLAVGCRPVAPAHVAVDGKHVFDSNSILMLKKVPRTMVVLGAGIIGAEYASMFATAGTKVTLVDRRHEILATVDREIVNHLVERFTAQGMEILLGCEAERLERPRSKGKGKAGASRGAVRVHLSNGRKLTTDVVLVSQGRFGNTEGLGLEEVGVDRDERGLIKVDQYFRTTVPNIYAVGDVIGAPALASTSYEQGRMACAHAFQIGEKAGYPDYAMSPFFPYGIYTIPEISIIGQTEEELVAKKVDFVAGRGRYKELARGQIVGDRWGLLKLLVERQTLKILGVHIIGDNAADLIHIGQAVMSFGGDVTYFIRTVFNYPTLAEAYKTAAFHAINQIHGTTSTR